MNIKISLTLVLCLLNLILQGCDSSESNHTPTSQAITNESLSRASRLMSQATFGMDYQNIRLAASQTPVQWINEQFIQPATYLTPLVSQWETINAGQPEDEPVIDPYFLSRFAWWNVAIKAEDVLRQRVAFALSQIFVVSDEMDELGDLPQSISNYYDMLLRNSFGNFRDLLLDVTLSPTMGLYLSHLANAKSDITAGRFPDENYARELMQLFSIGLYKLNRDGSQKLDSKGNAIATYSNADIREFARIFTGLMARGPFAGDAFDGDFDPYEFEFDKPMYMVEVQHEQGAKQLLDGVNVPAGQTGMQDIEAAIDNLFNHPNVGPFISLRLIQRLVTSNPSPQYISRVAAAFANNGQGIRGDMKAVIKSILLDQEAGRHSGKIREPALRYLSVLRQFHARATSGTFSEYGYELQTKAGQHPLSSPSVFNFYMPGFSPAGLLQSSGLKSPEMQITTDNTIIGISNLVYQQIIDEYPMDSHEYFGEVKLDLEHEIDLAVDVNALINHLDLLLTYNTLTPTTRKIIHDSIIQLDDNEDRVRLALYLILISPDYVAQVQGVLH